MQNTKIKTPDDSVRGHVRVRQFILICVRGRSASAKNLADGRQSADTVRVRTTLITRRLTKNTKSEKFINVTIEV